MTSTKVHNVESHDDFTLQSNFSLRCVTWDDVFDAIETIGSNALAALIHLLLPVDLSYITYIFNIYFTSSSFRHKWSTNSLEITR